MKQQWWFGDLRERGGWIGRRMGMGMVLMGMGMGMGMVFFSSAQAAIPPKVRAEIMQLRALALKIRTLQRRRVLAEYIVSTGQKQLRIYRGDPARWQGKVRSGHVQEQLRQLPISIQRSTKEIKDIKAQLHILQKQERPIQGVLWRGHLYYHPTKGLQHQKIEGAELIISAKEWRATCPNTSRRWAPFKILSSRSVRWGNKPWQVTEIQRPSYANSSIGAHPLLQPHLLLVDFVHWHPCSPAPLWIWDTTKQRLRELPAPSFDDFWERYPALSTWVEERKGASFRMLSFDSKTNAAMLLFSTRRDDPFTRKLDFFLVRWDVAARRLHRVVPLPQFTCHAEILRYDLPTQTLYFLDSGPRDEPNLCLSESDDFPVRPLLRSAVMSFHLPSGKVMELAILEHPHELSAPVWGRDGRRVVLLEHHTLFNQPRVFAYLLDLKKGTVVQRFAVERYESRAIFSHDERHLLFSGRYQGKLWRAAISSGKTTHRAQAEKQVLAFGSDRQGREVYAVFPLSIRAFSAKSLRLLRTFPLQQLQGQTPARIGDAMVAGDTIFLVDRRRRFFVLHPQRKKPR